MSQVLRLGYDIEPSSFVRRTAIGQQLETLSALRGQPQDMGRQGFGHVRNVLWARNDRCLAQEEQVRAVRRQRLGETLMMTSRDFEKIAILQDQADLDGAWEQIERALSIFERVYGPDHPRTVIARKNLATIGE